MLSTHAGSHLLSPQVFHQAFKDLNLISILGLTQKTGIVFQDFVAS